MQIFENRREKNLGMSWASFYRDSWVEIINFLLLVKCSVLCLIRPVRFVIFHPHFQLQHMNLVSSTPEMLTHLEGTISLFRSINSILKRVNYHDFKYGTMLKPSL